MPPPINPRLVRIFIERVKDLAMQTAKEMSKAANQELAVEFFEELAKEIAQRIAKELMRRCPDLFEGPTPKEENTDGLTGEVIDRFCGGNGNKPDEKVMDQWEKSIDDIISSILFGERSNEPQQSMTQDEDEEAEMAQVKDVEAEMAQLSPEVFAIEVDSDKEELPPHDERVIKLWKELKSLQQEWLALTLSHATESPPGENAQSSWRWKWIIIWGIVLVVLVGGAVYLWYHWHGGSRGGGNGDNGGAGEDRANAVGAGDELHGQVEEVHRAGQAGLQILLYGSGPPSGPLMRRRLVAIDGSGTRTIPASHPASPVCTKKYMYKNRLQEFAERTYQKLPIYKVEPEGECHHPKFRCTVKVGGQQFASTVSFNRKKEAEQDAARVAYENLATIGEGDVNEVLGLIDQDTVFCKSILHEFAVKTKTTCPSYSVVRLDKPIIVFVASVVFDGNTYTGESASNKKDAGQTAARTAIKSILAKDNACMMEIIRSKKHLITAIRFSGSTPGRPEHAAPASQDESSSLGVQGCSIVPAVGTSTNISAKAVTGSKKCKGRAGGPVVNETVVVKEH